MSRVKIKLFVALGTQKFPFDRLVRELNALVEEGVYAADEIVMQSTKIGKVQPLFTCHEIIPVEEFNRFLDVAEVVVCHSGVNSILSGMQRCKPLVIVPRISRFGEHVDDHQLEIAKVMEERYRVLVARDMADLRKCIEDSKTHVYLPFVSQRENLVSAVRDIIEML